MQGLSFTKIEMAAIAFLAAKMATVDGHGDEIESDMMTTEMFRFGVSATAMKNILLMTQEMSSAEVIRIVHDMTPTQKRYVTAYLGTLMAIDGDIDDKEMTLWRIISTLCNLPSMDISEALNYMADRC